MMERCYIAGSITNGDTVKSSEQREQAFADAEYALELALFHPVNPMKLPHAHDKLWLSYMRECLTALLTCEAIYMLQGWEQSKGAKIEHKLAKQLGFKIFYQ